jgi:hypothetical protein
MERPYRMWLYPWPVLVALAGWLFVFASVGLKLICLGLGSLTVGVLVFAAWSWKTGRWPFAGEIASGFEKH